MRWCGGKHTRPPTHMEMLHKGKAPWEPIQLQLIHSVWLMEKLHKLISFPPATTTTTIIIDHLPYHADVCG